MRVGVDRRDRPRRHRDAAHPRGARVPGRASCARTRRRAREGRKLPFDGGEVDVRGAARRLLRRPRSRDHRRRRPARARVGAAGRRGGRDGHRQLRRVPHGPRRPARGRRGEPRRPARPAEGHRVVPELHDDGPRHRARAAAPRRAASTGMVVSTYQSVSGAGQAGLHELDAQWTKLAGRAEELRRAGHDRRPARRRARSGPSRSPAT